MDWLDNLINGLEDDISSTPSNKPTTQDNSTNLEQNIIKDKPSKKSTKANLGYNPGWEEMQDVWQNGGRWEGKSRRPWVDEYLKPEYEKLKSKFADLKNQYDTTSSETKMKDDLLFSNDLDPEEGIQWCKQKAKEIAKEKRDAIAHGDKEAWQSLDAEEADIREYYKSYVGIDQERKKVINQNQEKHNSFVNDLRDLRDQWQSLKNTQKDTEHWHDTGRIIEREFKNTQKYLQGELAKLEMQYTPKELEQNEEYQDLLKRYDNILEQMAAVQNDYSPEQLKPYLDKYGYKPADYTFYNPDDPDNLDNLFNNIDELKVNGNGKNN